MHCSGSCQPPTSACVNCGETTVQVCFYPFWRAKELLETPENCITPCFRACCLLASSGTCCSHGGSAGARACPPTCHGGILATSRHASHSADTHRGRLDVCTEVRSIKTRMVCESCNWSTMGAAARQSFAGRQADRSAQGFDRFAAAAAGCSRHTRGRHVRPAFARAVQLRAQCTS